MTTTEERFTAIEANLKHTDELLAQVTESNRLTRLALAEVTETNRLTGLALIATADRVAKTGEIVEVLGRYVDTTVDYVQQHEADPDAHDGGE